MILPSKCLTLMKSLIAALAFKGQRVLGQLDNQQYTVANNAVEETYLAAPALHGPHDGVRTVFNA